MTWIQTFTGKKFSLTDPQPEDVDLIDICAALSKIVRFNGHCSCNYTVAQHSIHVGELVPLELQYDALLHDAPEAYYGDITRPMKLALRYVCGVAFDVWKDRINAVVYDGLEVKHADHDAIKYADNVMLATEARDLMGAPPEPWVALPPPRGDRIVLYGRGDFLRELFYEKICTAKRYSE